MKAQHDFVAEGRAAQHCAELLGRAQAPFDMAAASAEFAAELALSLPERLQALLAGPRVMVSDWPAEAMAAGELASNWSTPSIHFSVALGRNAPRFVISFDNAAALSLTDRLFGGRGGRQDDVPRALPNSAVLSVERLVCAVAETLARLCGQEGEAPLIASQAAFRRLGVFRRNERCLSWSFTVEQQAQDPWSLRLAVPEAAMRAVLESHAGGSAAPAPATMRGPNAEPFGAIPLPLTAVLAELRLPLAQLAALQPGQCIPLSIRREVPLAIGQRIIAAGTVGTLDERVALRLTQIN
ncbi:MAG: hypothetical protein B7X57_02425 [Erythrobacter sp. 34-65-8]|nr:MAG: hypothetical protein B7X57_02425 [Erythrobacter sp. 34-65-8]